MKKFMAVLVLVVSVFVIPVASAYQGTAICDWDPPTTFEDGKALVPAVDLSGFRVKCGAVSGGPYPSVYPAPGGTTTTLTVPIPVGTTYCVVTAVTTSVYGSLESAPSVEGSKTITAPPSGGCKTFNMR